LGGLGSVFLAAAFLFADVTAAELPLFADSRSDLTANDHRRVLETVASAQDFSRAERYEANQGGAGSIDAAVDRNSLSHPSAVVDFDAKERFHLGEALFDKLWVSAPASTRASDGLGPLFNARACQSCHVNNGRGHPPEGGRDATSMLIRLARAARTGVERAMLADRQLLALPDPAYGGQLQDRAVPGLSAEGRILVSYRESPFVLSDGETVSLRHPRYEIIDLAYGPLAEGTTLSPRVAPAMIGLGLIDAIHPADILANADPEDLDGDGISGRVSMVRDPKTGALVPGRFGWKASEPSLRSQNAAAFSSDIGISTSLHPTPSGDCTAMQIACLAMPNGVQANLGSTEAPDPVLDLVTFYTANLAVPRRRDVADPEILRGKELFYAAGCVTCHVPKFVTRRDTSDGTQAFQLIWPYSDFLLHDMGPLLADGQAVGDATGREWRTPPLWGIGLTETVSGHSFFLHDGRARNLTEAILWHGGEAAAARNSFAVLERADRQALIAFLRSL